MSETTPTRAVVGSISSSILGKIEHPSRIKLSRLNNVVLVIVLILTLSLNDRFRPIAVIRYLKAWGWNKYSSISLPTHVWDDEIIFCWVITTMI